MSTTTPRSEGRDSRSLGQRIALATALFLIAFAADWFCADLIGNRPFVLFFPAATAVLLVCGPRIGNAFLGASALAGWWFFLRPHEDGALYAGTLAPTAAYLALGWMVALIVSKLSRTLRELHASNLRLSANEKLLSSVVEEQTELISRARADGRLLYVNQAFCRYFERARDELLGRAWSPIVLDEDRAGVERELARLSPSCSTVTVEHRVQRPSHPSSWVQFVHRASFDSSGQVLEIQSVGRDVSARKVAELALAASEQRFRSYFESSPQAMFLLQADTGRLVDANEAASRFYGYPRSELAGMPIERINTLPVAEIRARMRATQLRGSGSFAFEHRLADGSTRRVEVFSVPTVAGGPPLLLSSVVDVTERHRLQAELSQSEAELRDLFDNAPCGYHSLSVEGVFQRINETELAWLGRRRDAVVGRLRMIDVLGPADRIEFEKHFARLSRDGFLRNLEFDLTSTDGTVRHVQMNTTVVYDVDGVGVGSRSVVHDITDLAHVRRALEHVSREQAALLENDVVGIVRLRDRVMIWANPAMHRMLRYESGELVGRPSRILHADEQSYERIGAQAAAQLGERLACRVQLELQARDGQLLWFDAHGAVLDARTLESVWFFVDISAMKNREAELRRQVERDSLTGTLSRAALMDALGQAIERARIAQRRLAMLFFDLDDFKGINDRHGHPAGDAVLCAVAQRIAAAARRSDIVGRIGGDEFVMVLEDIADDAVPMLVASKARELIAKEITLEDGTALRTGASIGTAIYPDDGRHAEDLLAVADRAMYEQKNSTRAAPLAEERSGVAHTAAPGA